MPPTAIERRRTGLCPTLAIPSAQRDGLLMRVPLVGGALAPVAATEIAAIAADLGNGIIELTNRANIQIRGVRATGLDDAVRRLVDVGFGDPADRIVTISPLASVAARQLRDRLAEEVRTIDTTALATKFVVHVADPPDGAQPFLSAAGLIADTIAETADVVVRPGEGSYETAAGFVVESIRRCIAAGPQVRLKDLGPTVDRPVTATVSNPIRTVAPGIHRSTIVVVGAVLGRMTSRQLAEIAAAAAGHSLAEFVVTTSRSVAIECADPAVARAVGETLADAGLLVGADHPAVGVVACIGAAGCWQTELDTLDFARRVIADRACSRATVPGAVIHVSGCAKSCAMPGRSAAGADVTFVGRDNSSGFDRLEHS